MNPYQGLDSRMRELALVEVRSSVVLGFQSSKPGLDFNLVQLQTPRCEVEIIINSYLLPHLHCYLHAYTLLASVML